MKSNIITTHKVVVFIICHIATETTKQHEISTYSISGNGCLGNNTQELAWLIIQLFFSYFPSLQCHLSIFMTRQLALSCYCVYA